MCGYGIMAIMSAFQAEDTSSILAIRFCRHGATGSATDL